MELYQKLEERKPSPELLEAVRIIAEKDLRIKELEELNNARRLQLEARF